MLKQILEDMYIEPELLEMLAEEDKEMLFRKMREEQIRRWKLREVKLEAQERRAPPKRTPRKINFKLGADKNPWVWVMGEGPGDLPYEELVKKREQEELEKQRRQEEEDRRKAEKLATIEAQALLVVANNSNGNNGNDTEAVPRVDITATDSGVVTTDKPSKRMSTEEIVVLQKQRAEELFVSFKESRIRARKKSEQHDEYVENKWTEQEQKAKKYELRRKESFIKARERLKSDSRLPETVLESLPPEKLASISHKMETRRCMSSGNVARYHYAPKHYTKVSEFNRATTGTRPSSREAVVKWFRNVEKPKGVGLEPNGTISEWMHGVITRQEADALLEHQPLGCYLVRVSLRIWGYTVSVKGRLGVQHFMITTEDGHYQFVGNNMNQFASLREQLNFHQTTPITASGGECLIVPCTLLAAPNELYDELGDSDDDITPL